MKKRKFAETFEGGQATTASEQTERLAVKKIGRQWGATLKRLLTSPRPAVMGQRMDGNLSSASNSDSHASLDLDNILTMPQKRYAALSASEFGLMLIKKRKAMGLEHSDIRKSLKFREAFIEALEQGRYYLLPDNYFIKGFIAQYAAHLNLHEDIYLSYLAEHFQDEASIKKLLVINDLDATSYVAPNRYAHQKSPPSNRHHPAHFSELMKPMVLLAVVGLLYGGYSFFLSIGQKNNQQIVMGIGGLTAPLGLQKNHLSIEAIDDVWLKITRADGKVIMEELVPKGKVISLPNQDDIKLSSSSSNALHFITQDKTYRYMHADSNPLQDLDLTWSHLVTLLRVDNGGAQNGGVNATATVDNNQGQLSVNNGSASPAGQAAAAQTVNQ